MLQICLIYFSGVKEVICHLFICFAPTQQLRYTVEFKMIGVFPVCFPSMGHCVDIKEME